MVIKQSRLLKVSSPEGARIVAKIRSIQGERIQITVDFNKYIEQDNPPFSKSGVIKMTCLRRDYQSTIQKLTLYLETLFLKGLANENTNTSPRIDNDSRGNKKQTIERTIGVDEGKGSDTSVYVSSRGTKSTKGIRRTKPDLKVDKISDKGLSSEDQTRN